MTTISNADELRATYLAVFTDPNPTSASDIAELEEIGNIRFARELLGVLSTHDLIEEVEDNTSVGWSVPNAAETDFDSALNTVNQFLGTNNTNKEKKMSKTASKDKPAKVEKEETFHACYCGCGENVPSKSFYRPGHDARHAGVIGRLVAEDGNEDHYNDLPSASLTEKAKRITEKAREKSAAKEAREEARAHAKAERAANKQAKTKAEPKITEPVEGTVVVNKEDRAARRHPDGKVEYLDAKGNWKVASKVATAAFIEG